jgi:hypothetical protein
MQIREANSFSPLFLIIPDVDWQRKKYLIVHWWRKAICFCERKNSSIAFPGICYASSFRLHMLSPSVQKFNLNPASGAFFREKFTGGFACKFFPKTRRA